MTVPTENMTTAPPDSRPLQKLGLVAGEGMLPVYVAENARKQGLEVVIFSIGDGNHRELRKYGKLHVIRQPGMLRQNLDLVQSEGIWHIAFAGKVNKWLLLRDPRLDKTAIDALKALPRVNDDAIMLWVVDFMAKHGLHVVDQTRYLQNLLEPSGNITKAKPSDADWHDIRYGFEIAKEMGRLDIGQSIVVKDRMILAVEAIEGTDECLKRAGKLARKKGGVVVKVAKPEQDQRFDVPTVGVRTLKTMKANGLKVLATEANETLFLDREAMRDFADKNGMIIVSVSEADWAG